ncbi:MAG TPA: PilZ domain-containing protein [Anaeromyxobacteraceae bacterium]|nr:PilZ domain-containing protein [Anaeromyxobacteraceae bacterium]
MRTTRAPRVPVTLVVARRGARGEPLRAEDLSTSGLFLCCEEPYTVGTALDLAVGLPWGERLQLEGRVVRVGPGASGHVGMGVMFVRLDAAAEAALGRFVEQRLAAVAC